MSKPDKFWTVCQGNGINTPPDSAPSAQRCVLSLSSYTAALHQVKESSPRPTDIVLISKLILRGKDSEIN